jgi:biotin transport system substrate-specific component
MQTAHPCPPAITLLQRSEAARQAMLVLLFGALTAVSAQISIPLEPVPVTGQVFVVLVAGALLGPRMGLMSQLTYLLIGFLGAPVFAGGKAGPLVMLGSTAGYLVGFPVAAYLAGVLAARARSIFALGISLFAASLAILLLGGLWLGVWTTWLAPTAQQSTFVSAALAGIVPFLPLDVLKAAAATAVAWPLIRPRE